MYLKKNFYQLLTLGTVVGILVLVALLATAQKPPSKNDIGDVKGRATTPRVTPKATPKPTTPTPRIASNASKPTRHRGTSNTGRLVSTSTMTKPTSSAKPQFTPSPGTSINAKDGSEMVIIPAGEFIMGSSEHNDEKGPNGKEFKVYLTAYKISKYEVTVAQFRKFTEDPNGYKKKFGKDFDWNERKPDWGWIANHPMVYVNWNHARAYCQWAGGDLPTEAQWEKAARGTDGRKYPWGNDWDAKKCRCSMNEFGDSGGTISVGSYPKGVSPYGVHDMAGNVWEWCRDYYDENYYKNAPNNNPENLKESSYRVLRGRSWYFNIPQTFRCADRHGSAPTNWSNYLGFRVVQGHK